MKSKLLYWFGSFLFENQKFIKMLWNPFSPDGSGTEVERTAGKWITEKNDSLRFLNKLNDFLV